MTREEKVAQIHGLAVTFTNTKDAVLLNQTVEEIVKITSKFKYPGNGAVQKIMIHTFATNLLESIPGIVDGSVKPQTDREVNDSLIVFENLAEMSVD